MFKCPICNFNLIKLEEFGRHIKFEDYKCDKCLYKILQTTSKKYFIMKIVKNELVTLEYISYDEFSLNECLKLIKLKIFI